MAAPKPQAKSKGKGKGRQGKLSAFQDMPLDILCLSTSLFSSRTSLCTDHCALAVAENLDPFTLLNMSRANKSMHALFASKRSATVWQIVENAVYLPQLTATDVNPLQLAAVLYIKNCSVRFHLFFLSFLYVLNAPTQFCGRNRASIVDYMLLRRFCKSCQRAK
jgi:hypothetical protein